jgi:serine/threonine protein kinase
MRDQKSLRGTPGYISPEILRNEADCICQQADIWSLAATTFEILTGQLPFCIVIPPNKPSLFDLMAVAVNLDEEPPDVASVALSPVSAELGFIVRKALWKRREGRYASAEEMEAALRAHMESHDQRLLQGFIPSKTCREYVEQDCAEALPMFRQHCSALVVCGCEVGWPLLLLCLLSDFDSLSPASVLAILLCQ